ncbi:MAG: Fe-S cluster assembly protein SufB [Fastidiosipilaceae bacterium]|nr:Fe-S cluster assembly protein SufB [Clostridiaceae bacterium]
MKNTVQAGDVVRSRFEHEIYDGDISVLRFSPGLDANKVREISRLKGEPEWMTQKRLESFEIFQTIEDPQFGPDLSALDLDNITYYNRATESTEQSWDHVPDKIKDTFEKLGIPEAEQSYLAGVTTQYESEVVYHRARKELEELGVVFMDTDTGLKEYPELFKQYFGKLVPPGDNKFAALNGAVWSGGSFIYVPKGVHCPQPVQSYFRINSEALGQFERTLIIVDDDASLHYIEGCTAPTYSSSSLHAAAVEIFIGKNASCRYSTLQNWSNNVYNLVTKRSACEAGGRMEWVDGNIGSGVTMLYPACYLRGEYASGSMISVSMADEGQIQDIGARMIHQAPYTSSQIISKSLSRNGGNAIYRGTVEHSKVAYGAKSYVDCDTLILDEKSESDTIPTYRIHEGISELEHEGTVSKVSEEQLFYLMSRGLTEQEATEMIIMGFIEPFTRELPMEYAVELNQLLHLDMSESVG